MEKISSILPSNARIKSVDLKDSHPVRPGVTTYGRPVGLTASTRERLSISQKAKDAAFNETLAVKNPREEPGAKIVQDSYQKFFENRLEPVKEIKDETLSEQILDAGLDAGSQNLVQEQA